MKLYDEQEAVLYRRAQLERRMRELAVVMQYLQRLNLYNTSATPTITDDSIEGNSGNGKLGVLADNSNKSIVYRWDHDSDHDSGDDDNHAHRDVDGCEVRWIRETDPTGESTVASISSEMPSSTPPKSQDDTSIYSDFLTSLKSSSVSSKVSFIGHSFGGSTIIHLATSDLPSATALRHMLTASTVSGSNATSSTTTSSGSGNSSSVEMTISTQVAGMVLLDPWMFPCDTDCFGTK